jgi:SM-20-related protein
MPTAEFFAKLGIFVAVDFLEKDLCSRIYSEACSAQQDELNVVDGYTLSERRKPDVRRTKSAIVAAETTALVKKRLEALVGRLRSHFALSVSRCETPQFLIYNKGDFFRPHADSEDAVDKPDYIRARKLSAVIFLNGQTSRPREGCFSGGSLIFYGLMKDPRWINYGFPLASQPGVLVAFPSATVHEVSRVTHGQRYTIVSWFS